LERAESRAEVLVGLVDDGGHAYLLVSKVEVGFTDLLEDVVSEEGEL